jgi:hypothetical protein
MVRRTDRAETDRAAVATRLAARITERVRDRVTAADPVVDKVDGKYPV